MNFKTWILSMALAVCVSGFFPYRAAAQPGALPWQHQDIGLSSVPGDFTASDKSLTVQSSGADIWGAADSFHFAYVPVSGDLELVVQVARKPSPAQARELDCPGSITI